MGFGGLKGLFTMDTSATRKHAKGIKRRHKKNVATTKRRVAKRRKKK